MSHIKVSSRPNSFAIELLLVVFVNDRFALMALFYSKIKLSPELMAWMSRVSRKSCISFSFADESPDFTSKMTESELGVLLVVLILDLPMIRTSSFWTT